MAELNSLDIPVEIAQPSTGMADAVLHELLNHLRAFIDSNQSHVIDLSSLPMSETDKRDLEERLGQGEIRAVLSSMGDSKIFETNYSGIWWIKHYTTDEVLIAEFIEITAVPEILRSHDDDIRQSITELEKLIQLEQQEQTYE